LIPTPIQQVLSTIQKHQVQALLMGGQACVFYGAAQFSKDVDFLLLASEENFTGLRSALRELGAERIAVPPFDPAALARGHAVHFRCPSGETKGLRIDVMTRLRDLPPFEVLWERRTTITVEGGAEISLLSVEDLVSAKKTQRDKDWPMIGALVEGHYMATGGEPNGERARFWLLESRTPERLLELVQRFPAEKEQLVIRRPLLALAVASDLPRLREALDAEVRAEQDKDRTYWEPLKREMEAFRRAERGRE
jgi:hypothetical protein